MPFAYEATLRSDIGKSIALLKSYPDISHLAIRNMLLECANAQLPFFDFKEKLRKQFHGEPLLIEHLSRLRAYLTAEIAAINWIKKRAYSESFDSLDFKISALQILKEEIANLKCEIKKSDEEPAVVKNMQSLFEMNDEKPSSSVGTSRRRLSSSQNFHHQLRTLVLNYQQEKEIEQKKSMNAEIKKLISERANNETVNFSNLTINDLDLSHLDLIGSDFSGCQLKNVRFNHSDLRDSTFLGDDLRNKNFIQADFSDAKCQNVSFACSDLRQSIFNKTTLVEGMKLEKAHLSRALVEVFLRSARWWECGRDNRPNLSFQRVSFEDEDLSGLNLSGLYLMNAYFKGTNVSGTNFGDSDVAGAYFKGAKNFKIEQLSNCVNRRSIHLPLSSKQKKQQSDCEGSRRIHDFFPSAQKRKAGEQITKATSP